MFDKIQAIYSTHNEKLNLHENHKIFCFQDILKNQESRNFLRKHFCPFIRYLEETDPELKNITSYMKKMESYLFKILKVSNKILGIKESYLNLKAMKCPTLLSYTTKMLISLYTFMIKYIKAMKTSFKLLL